MIKLILIILFSSAVLAGCTHEGASESLSRLNLLNSPSPSPTIQAESPLTEQTNIIKLIERHQPLECTFANDLNDTSVGGTAYISENNHFRINAAVIEQNDPEANGIIFSIIGRDEWVYQWGPGSTDGFRIEMQVLQDASQDLKNVLDDSDQQQALVGFLEDTEYDCQDWETNDEQFELPTQVEFRDITTLIKHSS